MCSINGFENEFSFVRELNGKKVGEVNVLLYDFIHDLFYDISDDDIIKCWRNHLLQKSDILIRIRQVIKGVSIKKGIKNSVHVERLNDFTCFLNECGIPKEIVKKYMLYHFGDGSIDGSGTNRLSALEYKENHQLDIDEINGYFNRYNILDKAIDRFVLKGNNSDYYIDAIIYGEVNDFFYIKRFDAKRIIMSKSSVYSSAVHFGSLIVQPKNRCLNYNKMYNKDRFLVQIKWYNLYDEIIESINNKIVRARNFQDFMDNL